MSSDVATTAVVPADALMESVLFEDGLAAAVEAAEAGVPGLDPVSVQLAVMKLLAGEVSDRLSSDVPCLPGGDEAEHWERVAVEAHAVVNQVGAVRAQAVSQFARWGRGLTGAWSYEKHPTGHRDEDAADELGPLLNLGPYESDRLVDESVWMSARTPKLLCDVAAGRANLATVAAVATELQDARPETCELVEDAIRRRGVHRSTRVSARRSARTLVEGFEAAAARTTMKQTVAQQTGVWLDPHPTPGLALLSAAVPATDAEAVMTAVDEQATRTHRDTQDGRLLGEHRADAFTSLILRNVTLTAHVDVVVADGAPSAQSASGAAQDVGGADGVRQVLSESSVALVPRAGAVDGKRLAGVLAAHTGGRPATITITKAPAPSAGGRRASSEAYRPPTPLRELVIRRDRHCRFPGCTRPARYADLDHVRPWPAGPTSSDNLQCLCRRHHRTKQRGWRVTMDGAGVCTWTSPSGRRHITVPGLTDDVDDLAEVAVVRSRFAGALEAAVEETDVRR